MGLFGKTRQEHWNDFLVELGQAGIRPMLMDDNERMFARARGQRLFEFITQADEEALKKLDLAYRKWLKRTGQLDDLDEF